MLDDTEGLLMDLPPDAEAELKAVGRVWGDEAAAEGHVLRALALAPGKLAVHIGAYKFYLYRHRLADALPHGQACLDFAATGLGLDSDWRHVTDHPAFAAPLPLGRLWLQSLTAMGYCYARLGQMDEAKAALSKVTAFDPADHLSAARLLAVVERGGVDEDDDV